MAHEKHIWNYKMEVVELRVEVGFLMKTATVDIPFKLQVSKFIEALFPFHLQLAIISIVCPMAAWFTVVRFLR